MIFTYDLRKELCTFDYFGWLVQAKYHGATRIHILVDEIYGKLGMQPSEINTRIESILVPGAELVGLPRAMIVEQTNLTRGFELSSRLRHLVLAATECTLPRLEAKTFQATPRFTVTLRNQRRDPNRNSDMDAWRIFAEDIGAFVIEDWNDQKISLLDRITLYAGAEMNFGVACGPLFMCSLSSYPCVMFDWGNQQPGFYEKAGIQRGKTVMPWMTTNQYVVWEEDNIETIRCWYNWWRTR